ncbi:MAG: TraR/DksA C4-type zinc finger protein [Anaerolineales bacterium]|nr:TraR/DksA C4-type zinc finger protein [Anaerolineales bacterium]
MQIIKELKKERTQVLKELLHLRETLKVEIDINFGEGDPELVERDRAISLIREQERKLDALDQALQRARQGAYGICERCGQPIDPARLEAVPDTTLCVNCKMISERQQRYSR